MTVMSETEKSELRALYEDAEKCFGKLFEEPDDECDKCINRDHCVLFLKAGGVPEEYLQGQAKPTKEKTKETKAKETKPVKETKAKEEGGEDKPKKKGGGNIGNLRQQPKDDNGFVIGSKSQFSFNAIAVGKYTAEQIIAALDEKWPGKANKGTFGVFRSDVQREKGTYSASRGVKIVVDEKTSVLSFKEDVKPTEDIVINVVKQEPAKETKPAKPAKTEETAPAEETAAEEAKAEEAKQEPVKDTKKKGGKKDK